MSKIISARIAGNILLIGLLLLSLFHILVLLKIAPSDIVWGGNAASSDSDLLLMEFMALAVTLFFILIVSLWLGYIPRGRLRLSINIGLWIIFAFFILNTFANLASNITMEKIIFTPVALILALLALRLALEKRIIVDNDS